MADESLVDRWFVRENAYSTTVIAVRGETAIKAANKLHDSDLEVPIGIERSELDDYEEVDRDAVPAWGVEFLEEQHEIRSQNIRMAAEAGGSSE